ncbi:hypothetical protein M3P21_09410 [Ruegeria sp. 2012CJ41-6]|uniref:Uncharacterized protein n=1 Tax=Ruegeria spongiae TaxID=2942209 RepID=A0ABT0Q4B5_9RHOB|nr:hypothetical protein [Ruegeria spongiae]MCL6283744.1 hypothetical protein [Ruegeria spongiae]
MPDLIPNAAKKKMEGACKKVGRKIGTAVAPLDKKGKLEKAFVKKCQKEVKSVDKTVVKFFAEQLKKELAKKNKKVDGEASIPRVDGKWVPTPPGSGVPSLTIPITDFVLDPKLGTKGKVSIKVWADPREFEKKDKGVMVNFTVVNW